ncbi:hypothetical protein L7F22_049262 [Adiantum nelumboides]|nr:hypothetical protein [Adiantum nelumboides]
MAFPNFHGRRGENAGNFLDDLEMAFLVSGREDEEIKLRAFPLVLREEAKVWFQDLDMGKQGNWEALKRAFLLRYSGDNNPEEIWRKLSKLQQESPDSYSEYETQFLKLWTQWENSLPEGERAPNFLQKERFLAGLTPILREKVKCKFPESFKEALTWTRIKDRKLQFQRSWRDHSQAARRVTTLEQVHPSSPNGSGDPYLDRLRRVTKQLDSLSINLIHGLKPKQPVQQQAGGQGTNDEVPRRPPRREYYGEDEHGDEDILCELDWIKQGKLSMRKEQELPTPTKKIIELVHRALKLEQQAEKEKSRHKSKSEFSTNEPTEIEKSSSNTSESSENDKNEKKKGSWSKKIDDMSRRISEISGLRGASKKTERWKGLINDSIAASIEQPQTTSTNTSGYNGRGRGRGKGGNGNADFKRNFNCYKCGKYGHFVEQYLEPEKPAALKVKQPKPVTVRAITKSSGVVIEELLGDEPASSKLNPKAKEWEQSKST